MNDNSEFAIIAIGYNRLESIKRLLSSIFNTDYLGDKVDLIISIDNSGSNILIDYVKTLSWPHGKKTIVTHDKRLGLKKHVLKCGDFTKQYNYVCVLEDDLYVSPRFYEFAKQSIKYFNENKIIAGISLYSHQWHPYVNRPFMPIQDGYDIYLLQVASSWGQIWSKNSWENFTTWLEDKTDEYLHSDLMPSAVSNWSSKSWLKYHNRYLVDSNKYFIYPKYSLTTNFSDRGEHADVNTTYQVPLLLGKNNNLKLPEKIDDLLKYDSFFEYKSLSNYVGIKEDEIDISIYGNRKRKKRYLLTTEICNFKVIKSFGLKLRPIEANVVLNVSGSGIYLYDTTKKVNKLRLYNKNDVNRFLYEIKTESKKELLFASLHLYLKALLRKIA